MSIQEIAEREHFLAATPQDFDDSTREPKQRACDLCHFTGNHFPNCPNEVEQ